MSAYIPAGVELVKFFIILALQEARRKQMTEEQIEKAFDEARILFDSLNPDEIPDV